MKAHLCRGLVPRVFSSEMSTQAEYTSPDLLSDYDDDEDRMYDPEEHTSNERKDDARWLSVVNQQPRGVTVAELMMIHPLVDVQLETVLSRMLSTNSVDIVLYPKNRSTESDIIDITRMIRFSPGERVSIADVRLRFPRITDDMFATVQRHFYVYTEYGVQYMTLRKSSTVKHTKRRRHK